MPVPRALLIVSLLTASLALAQNRNEERRIPYEPANAANSATTHPTSAQDQAIRQALDAKLADLKFSGDALQDVIDRFRTAGSLNLFVNWRALEKQRVTRDLPVTLDLSNLPAGKALDRLLEQVGGDTLRLGWTIDQGVVTISTCEDLSKNTITRVYDIRRGIRGAATRDADIATVIRRVRGVDPLSWRDAGGSIGSIRELSGQLIVTQTPQVHQRIIEELKDIQPPAGLGDLPLRSTQAR